MKTVIALDIGTTHIKSILFDGAGKVLRQEKCATPLTKEKSGSVYRTEEIWRIVKEQTDSLCAACAPCPSGISITGMAEAGLVINRKTGEALTDILPWFDQRTLALAQEMTEEAAGKIFETTGLRNSFKYGIYKFLWLLKEQKLDTETALWLSVCDYVAYRLTGGKLHTDPTFAARTYVYDVLQGRWDKERIEAYGLRTENFPEVVPSGRSFGHYRGIPVALAGHDHLCAAFGLLYHNQRGICDSAGTSETYVGILPEEEVKKTFRFPQDSGLLYGPFVDGGYFYMANVPSSGHSVEWYRKSLQLQELSYEEMNRKLLLLERGPGGLLYFPYLTGQGAPWYRADMKGALIGITEKHDGIRILKGIIEGLQYQGKWLITILAQYHGVEKEAVTCAGGAVHNRAMMRMKADILNLRVTVPEVTEATLYGAAALFLSRNKGEAAAEEFLDGLLSCRQEYQPDEACAQAYEKVFREGYLPVAQVLGNINGI